MAEQMPGQKQIDHHQLTEFALALFPAILTGSAAHQSPRVDRFVEQGQRETMRKLVITRHLRYSEGHRKVPFGISAQRVFLQYVRFEPSFLLKSPVLPARGPTPPPPSPRPYDIRPFGEQRGHSRDGGCGVRRGGPLRASVVPLMRRRETISLRASVVPLVRQRETFFLRASVVLSLCGSGGHTRCGRLASSSCGGWMDLQCTVVLPGKLRVADMVWVNEFTMYRRVTQQFAGKS